MNIALAEPFDVAGEDVVNRADATVDAAKQAGESGVQISQPDSVQATIDQPPGPTAQAMTNNTMPHRMSPWTMRTIP
jgi:hypothetical protein